MTEIEILQGLLERAKKLPLNDFGELDDIKRKGKMILENLLPTKMYSFEIEHLKFEKVHFINVTEIDKQNSWFNAQIRLINLLQTALLDATLKFQKESIKGNEIIKERVVTVIDTAAVEGIKKEFANYKRNVKTYSIFLFLSIVITAFNWLFFSFSEWTWYYDHPKKLSITLMVNLTLLICLLNIPLRSRWLIWIPIIATFVIALISII